MTTEQYIRQSFVYKCLLNFWIRFWTQFLCVNLCRVISETCFVRFQNRSIPSSPKRVFCNILFFFLGLIVSLIHLDLREDSHRSGTSSWKQEITSGWSGKKSQRFCCALKLALKDENNSAPHRLRRSRSVTHLVRGFKGAKYLHFTAGDIEFPSLSHITMSKTMMNLSHKDSNSHTFQLLLQILRKQYIHSIYSRFRSQLPFHVDWR